LDTPSYLLKSSVPMAFYFNLQAAGN